MLVFEKIISGLVFNSSWAPSLCASYFRNHRWADTGGFLTVLAPNALVFSHLTPSVWEAFEPRWVSQLPLIFLYKCGKHEAPLLSSAWACTQQKWLYLQAAQWYCDKWISPVKQMKIGIKSKPPIRCAVQFSPSLSLCEEWVSMYQHVHVQFVPLSVVWLESSVQGSSSMNCTASWGDDAMGSYTVNTNCPLLSCNDMMITMMQYSPIHH